MEEKKEKDPTSKNIEFIGKLLSPEELKTKFPLNDKLKEVKRKNDEEIEKIFKGESKKLLLVIGPCSADNEDSVMDYMKRLAKIRETVKDEIFIVPRLYSQKPRTTCDGYKGMLHQPNLKNPEDLSAGLAAVRNFNIRVLEQTGFSCADEMLYPEVFEYLNDVLSYLAVGARSSEDQQHRLTASFVSVPVGMKNTPCGDLSVLINSVKAGQNGHSLIYRNYEIRSKGNEYTHAILRGGIDNNGKFHPNYHYEKLRDLLGAFKKNNLKNPSVIIDCNHANSAKKCSEEPRIAEDILQMIEGKPDIYEFVKGFMIESYIENGNQKTDGGVYGKSITDECLGWPETEKLILKLDEMRKNHKQNK